MPEDPSAHPGAPEPVPDRSVLGDQPQQHLAQVAGGLRVGRRQHADAQVRRPASGREQPVIAGKGAAAKPDVALAVRAIDIVEVGPHRHDPVLAGRHASAQRPGHHRVAAVGSKQQSGAQPPRACRAAAADGDRVGRQLHRLCLSPVPDGRPGPPGSVQDPGIQLQPGNDPAVAGDPVNLRDAHHGRRVVIDVQRQTSHRGCRAECLRPGHAEIGQLRQRHRTDEVPAHLVAREAGPVDQHGPEPSRGQPRGRRRPGRAAADDDHIAIVPRPRGARRLGGPAVGGLAVRLHRDPSTRGSAETPPPRTPIVSDSPGARIGAVATSPPPVLLPVIKPGYPRHLRSLPSRS